MGDHYIEDIDIPIMSYCNTNLSGASSALYSITKPSGTKVTMSCVIINQTLGATIGIPAVGTLDEVGLYDIITVFSYTDGRESGTVSQVFKMKTRA